MEENNESLFGISIDPIAKTHLTEAAKWAKFLGILGFILTGFAVLGGIAMLSTTADDIAPGYDGNSRFLTSFFGSVGLVVYLIMALTIFFPSLFMVRFAGKMKTALAANDQQTLSSSFQNLKLLFRFWGIMAIIIIAFYVLVFVAIGGGWLAGSM